MTYYSLCDLKRFVKRAESIPIDQRIMNAPALNPRPRVQPTAKKDWVLNAKPRDWDDNHRPKSGPGSILGGPGSRPSQLSEPKFNALTGGAAPYIAKYPGGMLFDPRVREKLKTMNDTFNQALQAELDTARESIRQRPFGMPLLRPSWYPKND